MPLVLPYQNAENAFSILGDCYYRRWNRNCTYFANFGADDAKVAKEATPEIPPMLVFDENGTRSVSGFAGKFCIRTWRSFRQICEKRYYNEGEAPERSVDVEIAIS
jgi:isoleucyl-tRNA synthetase